MATVLGTDGDNTLNGTADDDTIIARGGSDTINAGDGNDVITIEADPPGTDTIDGGDGVDTVVLETDFATTTVTFDSVNNTLTFDSGGGNVAIITNIEQMGFNDRAILIVGAGGFATIQEAVDAASDGDLILIAPGTYTENVVLTQNVTLSGLTDGMGGGVVIDPPSGTAVSISGDIDNGGSGFVRLENIDLQDGAVGVGIASDTVLASLELENVNMSDFTTAGVISGSGAPGLANIGIFNSDFSDAGQNIGGTTTNGSGAIVMFGYTGDATISNVNIDFSADAMTSTAERADNAIQFAGFDPATYDVTEPAGTITLTDVTITGFTHKPHLSIQGYTDLSGFSFTDVDVTGGSVWGYNVFVDPVAGPGDATAATAGYPGNFAGGATTSTFDMSGITVTNQAPTTPGFDTFVRGTDAADVQTGTNAADALGFPAEMSNDLGGNDTLNGLGGDDLLFGGLGDDTLDGGADTDTGVYAGNIGDYTIAVTKNAQGQAVSFTTVTDINAADGDDGTDTLTSVEALLFADGGANLTDGVQMFDAAGELLATFGTIQGAVDAAGSVTGAVTILVGDGTFNENVVIDRSDVTLISANGRASTSIVGDNHGSEMGAIVIADGVDNVTIGGTGTGFTVTGINADGTMGDAKAAIYFAGDSDNVAITDNELIANGDHAIATGEPAPAGGLPSPNIWINAIDYDASGGGGIFEFAGTATANLDEIGLAVYDASGNQTIVFSPFISGGFFSETGGIGFTSWGIGELPDDTGAIALVDADTGTVIEFISWEGTVTAVDGIAAGATSTDIGVVDTNAAGIEVGRVGSGSQGSDFSWAVLTSISNSQANPGQTIVAIEPGLSNITVTDNTISGTSETAMEGAVALVELGFGGVGTPASTDVTFSGNTISGTTGDGAELVVINANNAVVDGNTFSGSTEGLGRALELNGENSDVTNNTLDNATGSTSGMDIDNLGTPGTYSGNVFNGGSDADILLGMTEGADDINGNVGNDTLTGSGGDDDIDGGDDFDTANYAGVRADYTISEVRDEQTGRVIGFTGITDDNAVDGDEGTDTLTLIEGLSFSDTTLSLEDPVQLYNSTGDLIGTFLSIQDAVDAAVDGQSIFIDAGTYTEDVTIDVEIRIFGAGTGTSLGSRDVENGVGETNVIGNWLVDAGPVSGGMGISGIRFVNDATTTGDASLATLRIQSEDISITDNIFWSEVVGAANDDRAIYITPIAGGVVDVSRNIISGSEEGLFSTASWGRGIWFDGGGVALTANDNVIDWARTAFNLEMSGTTTASLDGNDISNSGSGISVGVDTDGLTITNTNFENVGTDFNLRNLDTDHNFDVGAAVDQLTPNMTLNDLIVTLVGSGDNVVTGSEFDDFIDGNNDPGDPSALDADTLSGLGGNDLLAGRGGTDTLNGGMGDDALFGGSENDTAVFADLVVPGDVTLATDTDAFTPGDQAGWLVTTSTEGTDTLNDIEIVQHSEGQILLVGNGGFATIQEAIDAASDGDIVMIAPGTYAENIAITQNITLIGVGGVIIDPPSGDAVTISGDIDNGGTGYVRLQDIDLQDGSTGVRISSTTELASLELDNVNFSGFTTAGVSSGSGAPGLGSIGIFNSDFTDAGQNIGGSTSNGSGAIVMFGYTGNANISGVNITYTADAMTPVGERADNAIQFAGFDPATYDVTDPAGTVTLTNVTITGFTHKPHLAIQGYTDLTGFTFTNVDINGGSDWGYNIFVDPVASPGDAVAGTAGYPGNFAGGAGTSTLDMSGIAVTNTGSSPGFDTFVRGTDADDVQTGTNASDALGFNTEGDNDLGGNDTLNGLGGDDILFGGIGNDILNGGTGADNMTGGTGDDTYFVDDSGDFINEFAGEGNDRINVSIDYFLSDFVSAETIAVDTATGLTVFANNLDNTILGNVGDDTLFGDEGNDTFDGGGGTDTMLGGEGDDIFLSSISVGALVGGADNDTYYVDQIGDAVVEGAAAGDDKVFASIDYTLTSNVEDLELTGTAASGTGNAEDNEILAAAGVASILYGMGGNDLIVGSTEADFIDGGAGVDELRGGAGDDTYVIDDLSDLVVELANEGTDRINSAIDLTINDIVNTNIEIFGLTGAADSLIGNGSANILYANETVGSLVRGRGGDDMLFGGIGDDRLDGGGGADMLTGGAGNDFYIVDNVGDVVTELAGEGVDEVRARIDNYVLSDNVENVRLSSSAITATGNALANRMNASTAGSTLYGLAGMDELIGQGNGDDTFFGGGDNDTLNGKNGNDTLWGGSGDDIIFGGSGVDMLYGEEGADNLRGGDDGDTLSGGDNDDILDGEGGNDTLMGDDGDDSLRGGDGDDVLEGGIGEDLLFGEGDNDTLRGGDNDDQIWGGAGNDIIVGGAGRDFMTGDAGADTFVFDEPDMAGLTAGLADRIFDFDSSEGDKIDLAAIDAILGGGDDAFTFIGDTAFSGAAGELRFENSNGRTMVYMDTDGDGAADYAIRLEGTINLAEADFIL